MSDFTKITVRDFVVPALVGIYDHEKINLQRIRVSVEITLRRQEVIQDDISGTMSYEGIVQAIRALQNTHYHLVETIAEHLASVALADDKAKSVTVRVEKIDVFSEGAVGTEINRSKS